MRYTDINKIHVSIIEWKNPKNAYSRWIIFGNAQALPVK